ncbi:hypothetical protein FB561_1482 [Kribbella amoyensis]|uniref:Lipoprotein LpqN n=1 Tax=Kribbella amoyensis TaxID=996641 RepID=A0A561BNI2_9ACTN|nr:hypothetical protein [Kribbella amoyensis]TWD80407.1 hypothetical protein FB561_1482 [Kribbella amoyensis]
MKLTRTAVIALLVAGLAGTAATATAVVSRRDSEATGQGTTATTPTAPATTTATQTPSVAAADQQPAVAPLTPGQVKYEHRVWGDPKTEAGIRIWAPKDWQLAKVSTFEARLTSPNKLWNLRVNGAVSGGRTTQAAADAKIAGLRATPGIRILARVDGTTRFANPHFPAATYHHTTITYSYDDPARGPRLVVDRFVAVYEPTSTNLEISAGGRPEDRAALTAITDKATEDYIRLP